MKDSSTWDCDSCSQILFRDSTAWNSQHAAGSDGPTRVADLLSHKRLLYRCEVLQGGEQDMSVFWSTNEFYKFAQFLAQGSKHLIFVLHRLCATGKPGPTPGECLANNIPSKKGISSSRVLSAPKASAMVLRR